jgi:hypothetical protein
MIKLPILHHTDESSSLLSLGVRNSLDQCEINDVYFLNISAIAKYVENGVEYTEVFSNGDNFICDLPLAEVIKLLK